MKLNKHFLLKTIIDLFTLYLPFVLIFSVVLFLLFPRYTFPGGYKIYNVASGSMEPAIKTGSVILVQPQTQYKTGDIVNFRLPGKNDTATHRVVDIVDEQFKTKGDANDSPDDRLVKKDEIVGKAVFWIPYFGYPAMFAKTQTGFILLIVIPTTIIVYSEIVNIKNEAKRLIQERKKRKLNKWEQVEEKVGEEIMTVEAELKNTIIKADHKKKKNV